MSHLAHSRAELEAEKLCSQRRAETLRAEMTEMAAEHAAMMADVLAGTAEKAESRMHREQAAAAKKATTAAKKAETAAVQAAEAATAAQQAESRKREAAERELERLQAEAALVTEAAAMQMMQAAEQVQAARSVVLAEQQRRGRAESKASKAEAVRAQLEATTLPPTQSERLRERRESEMQKELETARVEVARLREALVAAEQSATGTRRDDAAEAPQLVGCRQWDADDAPLTTRDLTFCVQLVEESNGSFEGAATSLALVLGWLYGKAALNMGKYLLCAKTFSSATEVMGTLEDDAVRKANQADDQPWGGVGDGANKGRTTDVLAVSQMRDNEPASAPLGAHDLFGDQRTVNNITTATRAIEHAGLRPCTMVSFLTDGTHHAVQEGIGLCEQMAAAAEGKPRPAWSKGLKPAAENCAIHAVALEENHGITAAFPGEYHTHSALLIWEIVSSTEGGRADEYRNIWTRDLTRLDVTLVALPQHMFDNYFARLTKATTSKWEVSGLASRQILMLLDPPPGRVIGSRSMLEIFLAKCRLLFCGTLDCDKDKRVVHPHLQKIELISGVIHRMDFEASCRLLASFHESHLREWFEFAKSPSVYGGFEPPHQRHMMAERACKDTVFYRTARADPKAALPAFFAWLKAPRPREGEETMTQAKRTQYAAMAAAFLEAAQAAHLKWNGATWTRAHHLLGVLCLEERRRWLAAELLLLLGAESTLDDALVSVALLGCAHGEPPPSAAELRPAPRDAVDRVLLEHVRARASDGSLLAVLQQWGLDEGHALSELALLAAAPPQITSTNPVLSAKLTPRIHLKMRRLFVGFSHGLLIESMVSRLATVEKAHKGTHARVLYHLFMHKCRQAPIRKKRLMAAMRSACKGGLRKQAKAEASKGAPLKGSANCSKLQKLMLIRQTEAAAARFEHVQLLKRGPEGIRRRIKAARRQHDEQRLGLAEKKVADLAVSCLGPRRAKPKAASHCALMVHGVLPPNTKVKKTRLNSHKLKERIKVGTVTVNDRIAEAKAHMRRDKRKRPVARSGKAERSAADRPDGVAVGQTAPQPKRARPSLPRAAAAQGAAAASAAAAADGEEDDDEDDVEPPPPPPPASSPPPPASSPPPPTSPPPPPPPPPPLPPPPPPMPPLPQREPPRHPSAPQQQPPPVPPPARAPPPPPEDPKITRRVHELRNLIKLMERQYVHKHGKLPEKMRELPEPLLAATREYESLRPRRG